MATIGDSAFSLIKESKRSGSRITPYNQEMVRQVLTEISDITHEVSQVKSALAQKSNPDEQQHEHDNAYTPFTTLQLQVTATILFSTRTRNEQCLCAYHKNRLDKLMLLCWDLGAIEIDEVLKENLHGSELTFMDHYKAIMREYNGEYLDVDVGGSLIPPKDVYIEVRVLKDCGQIMTENGPLTLNANSLHYMRRVDVEHFIAQGYIRHVVE